jgi:hypothetical protein
MRRRLTYSIAALALLIAGCGGSSTSTTDDAPSTSSDAQRQATPMALEQAARTAIEQNAKVSDYVLSNNAIPSWASQSTAGPALAGLRGSAAQRKRAGVRVRVLASSVTIHSIELNPSYLSATAAIVDEGRVRVYKNGRPERHAITLKEPARVALHRIGNETRFVVWKLTVVK